MEWWRVFSVMSVHRSVQGGVPCGHYPGCIGPHCTGYPSPVPLVVTSVGHHWRPVQICSLEDPIVLTFGSHRRSVWRWQAGEMHPTGMLSCLILFPNFKFSTYSKRYSNTSTVVSNLSNLAFSLTSWQSHGRVSNQYIGTGSSAAICNQ